MNQGWKTTEFWTMIVTNGIGIALAFGLVNAEQGQEIGNGLKAIAGAVISIASVLGYMKNRTAIKQAEIAAKISACSQTS